MEIQLLVVGGGPAGLAAAAEAAASGVEVVLADEQRTPGGALVPLGETVLDLDQGPQPAVEVRQALGRMAESAGVTLLGQTLVWGLFDDLAAGVLTRSENLEVRPQGIVVAAGAFDRPLPFPGWENPDVLPAQEALRLAYLQDVLRGRSAVVASAGGGGVLAALALQAAGVRVGLLAEADHLLDGERQALRAAGIPLSEGARVTSAHGDEYLTGVTVREAGGQREIGASILVLATGRAPLVELLAVAGCEMHWAPEYGGYVPTRGPDLETSTPGLYAAGAAAGVCGIRTAVAEGRLAGAAAAGRLGRPTEARVAALREEVDRARAADAAAVAREMDALRRLESASVEAVLGDPGVLLCRCEKVRIEQVREAITAGARTPGEVKRATRVGMGECQGRNCRPLLSHVVATVLGTPVTEAPPITYRPPVRPVPLEALLQGTP